MARRQFTPLELSRFQESFKKAVSDKRVSLREVARGAEVGASRVFLYAQGKKIPCSKNHRKLEVYLGVTLPFYE